MDSKADIRGGNGATATAEPGGAIRSCFPVTGNWYVATDDDGKWDIERVVLWALIAGDARTVDHIRGITGGGLPNVGDDQGLGEQHFVHGPDMSPNGKTWDQMYEATKPNGVMIRDISKHFSEMDRSKIGEGDL